ncbi:MAG: GAF domain-containing protein [Sandaracinaceae bacterium]|nr:GAF domain-containing protein [Sandaracinaceae bacterium]
MGITRTVSGDGRASELAAFIRSNADAIMEDWERSARELPSARKVDRATLLDFSPALLERIATLAEALVRGQTTPPDAAELAAAHAQDRLAAGFGLDEMVREYSLLRAAVLERLERAGVSAGPREVRLLDAAIDASVSASVRHYLSVRDRWLRALDRIGSAALESRSLCELLDRLLRVFVENTPSIDVATILLRDGEALRAGATVSRTEELGESFDGAIADFVQAVASRRAPLSAADFPDAREALRARGIRGVFGVPLLLEGELLGVALVGSRQTPELADYDRRLVTAMTSRATTGVHHFMLRERTEEHARRERAVADLGQRMLKSGDVAAMLVDAARTAARALPVELVEIAEREPDTGELVARAGYGPEAAPGAARMRRGPDSLAEHALATDGGVVAHDLAGDTRFARETELLEAGARSGMCVAIRAPGRRGGTFGVLGAFARGRRVFGDDDLAFLRSVANLIASAIARDRDEARIREAEEHFRLIVEQVRDHSMITLDREAASTAGRRARSR